MAKTPEKKLPVPGPVSDTSIYHGPFKPPIAAQTEKVDLEAVAEKIATNAEESWRNGECMENGCGCWTEYVKASVIAVLSPTPTEQVDAARLEAEKKFEDWWNSDGGFYDPDSPEVPWFDKRKDLAGYAFLAGASSVPNLQLFTIAGAKCICCQSDNVTLCQNNSARWVQCNNERCGNSHFVATHPELAKFFRASSLKLETQPPPSKLGYECMLSVLNRIGEIVGIKNEPNKFSGDELVWAIKKLASSSPPETPARQKIDEQFAGMATDEVYQKMTLQLADTGDTPQPQDADMWDECHEVLTKAGIPDTEINFSGRNFIPLDARIKMLVTQCEVLRSIIPATLPAREAKEK